VSETWSLKPGDLVVQCRVVRPLGAGLHGEVYMVEHLFKERCFALKLMHLEDVRQASRVRRALSTAKASYRIQHANVIAVEELGCERDGRVWLLMEYLDGTSVGDLLARQRGRVSLRLAFHIAIEAAWGIDAAHELGIIHRDIKPENLWLTLGGMVKVLDFSLAKVIPDGIPTTQRKGGFGTTPFMSPEALRSSDLDARADVYSLGILLDQMLRGRHAFAAAMRDTTEMIRHQLYVTPEPLSTAAGLPAYVDDFMRRALAKDPAERFFTMAEMAQAMMVLRDRLRDDAARGEVLADVPPGEPSIPGDRWTRAAYAPPQPAPDLEPAPPITERRVVLAPPATALARTAPLPADLVGTQPLPAGLGGTQPLGADVRSTLRGMGPASSAPSPARSAQQAGRDPASVQVSEPLSLPVATSEPRAIPTPRSSAPETTRAARPAPPAAARMAVGVVAFVIVGLGVFGWQHWRTASPPPARPVAPVGAPETHTTVDVSAAPEISAPSSLPRAPTATAAPVTTPSASPTVVRRAQPQASPRPRPLVTPKPSASAAAPAKPAAAPHRIFDVQP
jgi:eukaryotic-like serine/threonine-protein kinase